MVRREELHVKRHRALPSAPPISRMHLPTSRIFAVRLQRHQIRSRTRTFCFKMVFREEPHSERVSRAPVCPSHLSNVFTRILDFCNKISDLCDAPTTASYTMTHSYHLFQDGISNGTTHGTCIARSHLSPTSLECIPPHPGYVQCVCSGTRYIYALVPPVPR
jgi:hypothetical protein